MNMNMHSVRKHQTLPILDLQGCMTLKNMNYHLFCAAAGFAQLALAGAPFFAPPAFIAFSNSNYAARSVAAQLAAEVTTPLVYSTSLLGALLRRHADGARKVGHHLLRHRLVMLSSGHVPVGCRRTAQHCARLPQLATRSHEALVVSADVLDPEHELTTPNLARCLCRGDELGDVEMVL